MSTALTDLQPEFRPDPRRGGYAVLLGGAVIGHVIRCERHPVVWEAYTDAERTQLRGQRETRRKPAGALMPRRPSRDVDIPDEALDLLARAILGGPILTPADHYRVHDVIALPTRLTAAHTLRSAAYELAGYPKVAAWLEQRADEIDGGDPCS